jgi:hypothetical protein
MQWNGWGKFAALMALPIVGIMLACGVYAAQSNGQVSRPELEMLKYLGIAFASFIVQLLIGPWVTACQAAWRYERTMFLNNQCKCYWVEVRTLTVPLSSLNFRTHSELLQAFAPELHHQTYPP